MQSPNPTSPQSPASGAEARAQIALLMQQLQALSVSVAPPEPEPEPAVELPPVTLSAAEHQALMDQVEFNKGISQQLETDNQQLLSRSHRFEMIANDLQAQLEAMQPKVWKFTAPLLCAAVVAIIHTWMTNALAFANLVDAIKYITIGAALGLAVDVVVHYRHQPESLEGISQNGAWNRRMWLMVLCAVALAVRP